MPALFYIHGELPLREPSKLAHWVHQSQEVVVVSVYYRLAAFGFLSHPQFTQSGIADHSAGFLDQVQSLNWVKVYIQYFGGGPGTMF